MCMYRRRPGCSWLVGDLLVRVTVREQAQQRPVQPAEDSGATDFTFSRFRELVHTHLLTSAAVSSSSSAGVWLKSEETVAMKTKRADFAAAFLRGRVVVAGGLGKCDTMQTKLCLLRSHCSLY